MNHLGDLLSAHLDGELDPGDEARVTSHLAECPTCTDELEAVSEARRILRALPMLEAPIPLLPAIRRRQPWVAAVASVAAAALAVGLALGPGQPTQVFDLDTMAGQHTTRVGVDPGISTLRAPVAAP